MRPISYRYLVLGINRMKYKLLLPWLMVFGAGLCMRTGISSLSPVLAKIQPELGISSSSLGLWTAIPVVCMGVLSPLGPAFDRHLGLKKSRPEERRVGTECVRTCRYRWRPNH